MDAQPALRVQLFDREQRQIRLTAAGSVLHAAARRLLADWDDTLAAVADAAAQEARILRVGTLTSIGRHLYPGAIDRFGKSQPGWRLELHSVGWGDPTGGLGDHSTDVAFVWLPVDAADIDATVLVTEQRYVAVSTTHPLATRDAIDFHEIIDEPIVTLPASAGPLRDFWLATAERAGRPPSLVAEVASADETFEIVSSGRALTLLAKGNAIVYSRPGIVCIPVNGLSPANLAVAWRRNDHRPAVHTFVEACRATVTDAAASTAGR